MPNFSYKAIDTNKKITEGAISARSKDEAGRIVTKKGLSPLVIKKIVDKTKSKGTIPQLDKITFCRYISAMLQSGLSLSEGIDVLKQETKHPVMKKLLGDISYSLEQGQPLSSVFERYPDIFESYFLTLTKAGEVSGTLGDVFKHLEEQLRSEYSLMTKVKGALLYPGVVFTAMIGIGFLMFFFVLPQIGSVFLDLTIELPVFTRILFSVSIYISQFMIPIIVLFIASIVASVFLLKKKKVRVALLKLTRPIPMVRNLIKKLDMARFTRIFSTLLKSAVPITQALEISLESLTWYEYRNLSEKLPDEIRKGKSLANVVKSYRVFPSLLVQMVAAGEKSGTLDETLSDLASFYEEEVEEELKSLTQILEPVLMLLVGIAVGVMILAIIAPIYSVVSNFQEAAGPSR